VQWGKVSGWELCSSGVSQSPLDLNSSYLQPSSDLNITYPVGTALNFTFTPTKHRFQFSLTSNAANIGITYNDSFYSLSSFSIATPSEHFLQGEFKDVEIQLRHVLQTPPSAARYASRGTVTQMYYSVLLQVSSKNMPTRSLLETIRDGLANYDFSSTWTDSKASILLNLSELVPTQGTAYIYSGSLTYPPCTENVLWVVNPQAKRVQPAIVQWLKLFYGNNARPIQN
jgi:carbonic anhydrase